ncbi:MAG: type II toxin-antitoxin system prevent-host-death family antitoxin [Solirubrobacterales bacterium]|nr:type II toxin-antitoxin system prevent-host-death family antitoxin [Solirubrobacterales bacterium]
MKVNVGQAKTDLSKLLRQVEAGEEVVIARDGVPVARLVREEQQTAGQRFLASEGSMPELAAILDVPDYTEEELDEIYDNPI